jgi:hypothetical protein
MSNDFHLEIFLSCGWLVKRAKAGDRAGLSQSKPEQVKMNLLNIRRMHK